MTAPSFSVPVFKTGKSGEESYIASTIALYTIITFIAGFAVFSIIPEL